MGNVFGGGELDLSMSNGGTAVFVEVLTLAVSDLVEEPWDFRFAALLALQDQSCMGRGVVGFDLEEVDWGASSGERARNKAFVLRVIDLALSEHRWDELTYDPPFAADYLRTFRTIVEAFDPALHDSSAHRFPGPEEAAMASCVQHRVLTGMPHWEVCVFCSG
ncbi:hypothetical protein [Streptomyces cinnamoneus]|uniref:Uncharacterized protein n=1 Tax=Streptomyces cinnamoneus TaxID=53446 RepID=A0A918WEH7_STRCJ|nr:hypothetical protein [Streptomyces cinnamoneus]GHC40176.1 hypothetical protein GCM10010507_12820 [Streptomyces cinnamoneus]